MKVTGINPVFAVKDFEETLPIYEALGFKVIHKNPGLKGCMYYVLADEEDHRFDVALQPDVDPETDITQMLRINVDDFDEAYKLFTDKGFTSKRGVHDTDSFTCVSLTDPTGCYSVYLTKHKRKD